jgi:peptidoglycan/LPS O-acetylase OafA/YrhL
LLLRKDIQALRALAVMAVFVYHMRPNLLTGGFIGVDVFFVLSGFLISAHLFHEFERTGTLSLSKFWSRRAMRLLPASLTVLAVTAIGVWALAPQALQERFFRDISAASLYAANWVFAFDSVDYLAAENSPSVVQHFWSLGVEEQLYIAWPLLLLVTWMIAKKAKIGFKYFGFLLAIITAGSLIYSIVLVADNNPIAYFSTFSRAWEFGAGALLALWMKSRESRPSLEFGLAHLGSWLGWISLIAYMYFFEATAGFPGVYAVTPVISTLLIIASNNPQGRLSPARLLNLRPIQFLGDASYSIYLWHWPILVFVGFNYERIPWPVLLAVMGTTFVLSALSLRLIENPFRYGALRVKLQPKQVFIGVATSMILLVGSTQAAGTFIVNDIEQQRLASNSLEEELAQSLEERQVDAIKNEIALPVWDEISCMGPAFLIEPECSTMQWDAVIPAVGVKEESAHNVEPLERIGSDKGCLSWGEDYSLIECIYGVKGGTKIALIGDSHSYHWLPAFAAVAKKEQLELHLIARAGCPASTAARTASGDHVRGCMSWNQELSSWLSANPDVQTIVISNYAGLKFEGAQDARVRQDKAIEGYKNSWQPMLDIGAKVVIIKDTPFIGEDAWNCVVTNPTQLSKCDVPEEKIKENYDNAVAAAEELGLTVLDFTKYFCANQTCQMAVGGIRVYRDSNHMSGTFNLLMAPYLKKELLG